MIAFWCNIVLCVIVIVEFAYIAYLGGKLMDARDEVALLAANRHKASKILTAAEAEEVASMLKTLLEVLDSEPPVDDNEPFRPENPNEYHERERVVALYDIFRKYAL